MGSTVGGLQTANQLAGGLQTSKQLIGVLQNIKQLVGDLQTSKQLVGGLQTANHMSRFCIYLRNILDIVLSRMRYLGGFRSFR